MWIERSLGVTIERALATDPPDAPPIVVPHLYAERPSLRAPGHGASIVGLSPEHDAVDIARAFLVALAFGVRELIDLVEPFAGRIRSLTTSGEAGTSDAWLRLRASAYGRPIRAFEADATALGCLSLGLGALSAAADGVVPALSERDARVIEPDPELARRLDASYDLHRAMRDSAGRAVAPAPAATVTSAG
jgi:sugar (pentulose or hexulose) kinase